MHHPTPSAHACTQPAAGTPTDLPPGARHAGAVLDEAGRPIHHLILLAARPEKALNWEAAKAWAASVGGDLPSPQEQALLFANCRDVLPKAWCWSNKKHEKGASYAWLCNFGYGNQYGTLKSFEGSAVAVRRLILESFSSCEGTTHTAPKQAKTIAALRKRLERWELDHLRALSVSLHDQLEVAHERIQALQSDIDRAWRNAEAWQDDAMELVKALEAAGTEVGITQAGQLVAIDAQGGAA
jgi:hypothetical protein